MLAIRDQPHMLCIFQNTPESPRGLKTLKLESSRDANFFNGSTGWRFDKVGIMITLGFAVLGVPLSELKVWFMLR